MQDNPFARLRRESIAVYASTYAGPLTVPSWTVTGALAVGGNTTLTGALAVTGAATFASTVGVTGVTTLSAALSGTTGTFSSTLGVTGVLSANTIGVLTGTTATVYNTTATTVNAFGAATTLTLGAATGTCTIANATVALTGATAFTVTAPTTITGDLTLVGGDIIASTATTWNVLNTVATTINMGGAATAINMGAGASTTVTVSATTAVALNTGAITSNQTTVALLNTTTTTVNAFGAATALALGKNAFGATTTFYGSEFAFGSGGTAAIDCNITAISTTNNTTPATIIWKKARYSAGLAAVQANDYLGNFNFQGYTSAATYGIASVIIRVQALEAFTSTAQGTQVLFETTGVGTVTRAAALTLSSATALFSTTITFATTLVSSTTTANVCNTTATTVNAFGAASVALNIGNASGPITFAGRIVTTLSSTTRAYFNLPHGAAPTAPVNGDVWTTTAGLYVRINGSTVGPLS